MMERLKETLRASLPGPVYLPVRRTWHALLRTPYVRLGRKYARIHGSIVDAGPFRGMQYLPDAAGGVIVPKLLGSYEEELHEFIERVIALSPPVVVNVGCGEGYYAVGLALRLPNARIVALDSSPGSRSECRRLARLNGVEDRVQVGAAVDALGLEALLQPGALLVMDCEGCEVALLDPKAAPSLRSCTILVELHEFRAVGLTSTVLSRFAPTHDEDRVSSRERNSMAYPRLAALPEAARPLALSEYRPGVMEWALMIPSTR